MSFNSETAMSVGDWLHLAGMFIAYFGVMAAGAIVLYYVATDIATPGWRRRQPRVAHLLITAVGAALIGFLVDAMSFLLR